MDKFNKVGGRSYANAYGKQKVWGKSEIQEGGLKFVYLPICQGYGGGSSG